MAKIILVFLSRLINNEQLITRLSESYPMRRAAQFIVSMYYKNKLNALEFKNLNQLNSSQLVEKLKKICEELEKKKKGLE